MFDDASQRSLMMLKCEVEREKNVIKGFESFGGRMSEGGGVGNPVIRT